MNRVTSSVWTAVALVVALLGTGCQSNRSSRAGERTVIVQSTTQPSEAVDDTSRNIHVTVDDTAMRDTAHSVTVDALVGKKCRVQFRRDALGLISDSPTPPLGEGLFKRPVFLDGTLTKSGSGGVLLGTESGTVWIPWTSVLLIEARE